MGQKLTTHFIPELMRISGKAKPIRELLDDAIAAGLPILPVGESKQESNRAELEDSAAIDLSLAAEPSTAPPSAPPAGTSYAGLTPAQRHAFLSWCHTPEQPAPLAFQQLFLANLEVRLLEEQHRKPAILRMAHLGTEATWANNPALHRAYLLACWLQQDGVRITEWLSNRPIPADLLGVGLGLQGLIGAPLTVTELGAVVAAWKLGNRLPADLLKLRLDSLTAILGQPPLAYGLTQLEADANAPRTWRTLHRGLRFAIPQPDLRPMLEPALRDLLSVADLAEEDSPPVSALAVADASPAISAQEESAQQPSLEELGWRLILEFGSNRSEYFEYVLIQCQKLPGYSQLMDEDRRMIYRVLFRKSEMRRFWRIWDYVHGWTSTRVYLNGEELEKWKVWPYSQHLR
jgi:hypothetical protein